MTENINTEQILNDNYTFTDIKCDICGHRLIAPPDTYICTKDRLGYIHHMELFCPHCHDTASFGISLPYDKPNYTAENVHDMYMLGYGKKLHMAYYNRGLKYE